MNLRNRGKLVYAILVSTSCFWTTSTCDAEFVNGDFETGDMTGWTITLGPLAEVTNQTVISFDMNGPEPDGVSLAAQFAVGQATNGDMEYRYMDLTQDLILVAGQHYEFQFDWAAHNYFFLDNFDGGVFELIVDGNSLASWDTGSIFQNSTEWGTLSGAWAPTQSGSYAVGARISRRFRSTNNGTFILGQYLDNFVASTVPEPTTCTLIGIFGIMLISRRKSRSFASRTIR